MLKRKELITPKRLMKLNPSVKTLEQAKKILKTYQTEPKGTLSIWEKIDESIYTK